MMSLKNPSKKKQSKSELFMGLDLHRTIWINETMQQTFVKGLRILNIATHYYCWHQAVKVRKELVVKLRVFVTGNAVLLHFMVLQMCFNEISDL